MPKAAVNNDGLDIPDFLKLTPEQRAVRRHLKFEEIRIEEEVDPVEAELRADVRKMLAPAGVLTDDITRTLYLATKYKHDNKRQEKLAESEERREAKQAQRDEQRAAREAEAEKRRANRIAIEAQRASARKSENGKITINQIAAELGVLGRDARGALRSLGMKKPSGGWQFTATEAAAIKEKVRSCLTAKGKSPLSKAATTTETRKSSDASDAPSGKRSKRSKPKTTRRPSAKRRTSSKKR